MPKKKLIIDGQIFQTAARHRGMGRYSSYLIDALLDQNHGYDVVEVITTKDAYMSTKDKEILKGLFHGANLIRLNLKMVDGVRIESTFDQNEAVLNEYVSAQIAKGFKIDYLIPSLFQEPASVVFPKNAKKLLIFYDLIPYLYHDRYQPIMGPGFENYVKRFSYLFSADRIFTISQTVWDDLHTYLGIPLSKMACIDGAAIKAKRSPDKPRVKIPDKYILMPTSDDPRKNNLMAVLGFEEYVVTSGDQDCKLLITSKINKHEQEHLRLFSNNLVFTGNLPDEQLDWLYANCQSVLFVPEYEGLGLPILEAVEFGKQVACSAIGAFKEISEDAFCYCDYESPSSIAEAIECSLRKKPDLKKYRTILSKYTWSNTARRLVDEIQRPVLAPGDKPKIALFAPTPSGYSSVGKDIIESHAVMSEYFEIDYYLEDGIQKANTRPNILKYITQVYPAESFSVQAFSNYVATVYHIGNGDYHMESIKNALYLPGYVIIHDTNLSEAFRVMEETRMISKQRLELETMLDQKVDQPSCKGLSSITSAQLGILTHSQFTKELVAKVTAWPIPTVQANLPVSSPKLSAAKIDSSFTIGMAGIIAGIKGTEVIEAIAESPDFNSCKIKLFGHNFSSKKTTDRLNSYENVTVSISVSDLEFQNNLKSLDVFVNYRMSYQGETSKSTIEAMRAGVVVIVRNIGWYSELPDDVVVKVDNIDEVFSRLHELMNNRAELRQISKRARDYIANEFGHEQYALALKGLISQNQKDNPNHLIASDLRQGKIRNAKQYIKKLRAIT